MKCFTFLKAALAAVTSSVSPSLRSALGCHVASLAWLLQEQIESSCFHGYCLKLDCSDEVGKEKINKGESKKKNLKADIAIFLVTDMENVAILLG